MHHVLSSTPSCPTDPRRSRWTACLAAAALATLATGASAQADEAAARAALTELRALVAESTGVIGDLQPMINSGKVDAAKVSPQAIVEQLKARYAKASQADLSAPLPGLSGEVRQAYLGALNNVVGKYQGPLTKGGQDAFVPAYFRALVLRDFNVAMKGKVQAYATNRDDELINADWAVSRVMKGSHNMDEVAKLMTGGGLDPVIKRSGPTVMGYWPMKLGANCVACHAQNGLKQTEGGFGGALVAEVLVK